MAFFDSSGEPQIAELQLGLMASDDNASSTRVHVSSAIQKSINLASSSSTKTPPHRASQTNLSKTYVHLAMAFLKIGEIDTVKEQFSADIFIQAHWREPSLDNKTEDELKETDLTSYWNPLLYIENEMSERKVTVSQKVVFNDDGEAFVVERKKMRGEFLENLELQQFPLDVQDLSITVAADFPDTEVELIPDENDISSVNTATFADKQEWKLYEHVETTKIVKIEYRHSRQQHEHSAIRFTCHAARRAGFFCYNTFFIMFLIVSMSFGSFAVDCGLPQSRIHLTFTLVLTFVAYRTAVNSNLPKISYLTYMDKYVLMSLCFLASLAAWHAIAGKLCANKEEGSFYESGAEYWVALCFVTLYLSGNLTMASFLYKSAGKRRIEMAAKDRNFIRRVAGKTRVHQVANNVDKQHH